MERCKNCVFWDQGECRQVDSTEQFRIDVKVADDHNLEVKLMTGPEFGCVEFQPLVKPRGVK